MELVAKVNTCKMDGTSKTSKVLCSSENILLVLYKTHGYLRLQIIIVVKWN